MLSGRPSGEVFQQPVKSVSPTVLDALNAALTTSDVKHGSSGKLLNKVSARQATLKERDKVILGWNWKDEYGNPIYELGFDFKLKNTGSGSRITWPPKTFGQTMRIAHSLIKPANLWMVLLGNGPRNSEAVSMQDDCLVPDVNGNFRVKGRTFKMTGIAGGKETEVIVPEIIVQAIFQQMELVKIVKLEKGFSGNSLWIGERAKSVLNLSSMLNSYMDALELRNLLTEENSSCNEHRFRKTLAWIVAVTLTNSIMVLKDCFGHTDEAMTLLSYIISDPSVAQEVINVQKELTILMAVEVISGNESIAGPGAAALLQRSDEYLKRIGKSKFEPQDAYEFARRETFDGRAWMMVAPGVLCTAPHGITQVSTPCALGQKQHNPANCKTACQWQILLKGYFLTQADDSIDYSLGNLQRAVDDEDDASMAFWVAQTKTWLYRYEDVAEKWKSHPLVMAYIHQPTKIIMKCAA
jgi:integrase